MAKRPAIPAAKLGRWKSKNKPLAQHLPQTEMKSPKLKAGRLMLKHIASLIFVLSLSAAPAFAQDSSQIAKVQNGQSCPSCNLFQADLAYKDAKKMDLSNARLRQANLSLSTYDDVNFQSANLSIANLFGVRFNRANLRGANLRRAIAVGGFFGSSNLSGADLSGANFSGADLALARGLTQAQLNKACGDAETKLPKNLTIPSCS